MKRLLPFCFAILFLFSSCASVFNRRDMSIKVSSAHPCYLVGNSNYTEVLTEKGYRSYASGDLIPVKPHHPVVLTVLRDKELLRMEFVQDTAHALVEVRSKLSWVYYLNIVGYPPGIGFLGDIKTPKKWEYDNDVFVDLVHPGYTFTRHIAHEKVAENRDSPKVVFTKDAKKSPRRKS